MRRIRIIINYMMKKLAIPLLSMLISFNSYSEWTKLNVSGGDDFYIDIGKMKEYKGYVYWWTLRDFLEPSPWGTMSEKVYRQGDCGVVRYKDLSYIFYKQPMGEGSGDSSNLNLGWEYPDSTTKGAGILLDYVCNL